MEQKICETGGFHV